MSRATPGVLAMLAATACFTGMLMFVKLAGDAAVPLELVFWRGLLGGLAVMAWTWRGGVRVQRVDLLALRTVAGASAMMCFFTAVQGMTVAEVSLVQKVHPVLVTVAAPFVVGRGDKAEGPVWTALGMGLIGSAILLAPGALEGSWWSLWALAAALLSAVAHLTLRVLGRTERPEVIVAWFQLGAACFAYAGAWIQLGHPLGIPPLAIWPEIVGIAVCATGGQLFMTHAYRQGKAPSVAAATYAGPLFAVLVDALVFGMLPGWTAWVGGALVVAAGLTLLTGTARPERWVRMVAG